MLCFNSLIFVENTIMLLPLLALKVSIDRRNAFLAEDFPPTADEQFSTETVNTLLQWGAGSVCALPLVSTFLSLLYFTMFHAWSAILMEHVGLKGILFDFGRGDEKSRGTCQHAAEDVAAFQDDMSEVGSQVLATGDFVGPSICETRF